MINEKIDKNDTLFPKAELLPSDSLFMFTNSAGESLILQLFDLGKLFVDKKMVTFTALGTCMYPCIRQGDVIYIQPKNVEEIQVGEVAVYRRYNRLFSHRAIAKGTDEKGAYVITLPDTAKYGNDGATFNKDILGVVAQMKRRGKILKPLMRHYNLIEKIWFGFCFKCFYFKGLLLEKIIFLAAFLQQFWLYHLAARLFPQKLNKETTFVFSTSLYGKATDRFYRKITEQEVLGLILNSDHNLMSKWRIALKINSQEAAVMSFLLKPKSCEFGGWWLIDAGIKIWHRGVSVEKALWDKADGLFKQAGIAEIFAGVLRKSGPERMFLKGLGFRPIHEQVMRRKIA
ncbi:MAG: hypothetical protein NTX01_00490 [Candidatus Omnitrophica bacterium]|nr:hypothetical protein [Candidatus Omnitrophota bacterium]